MNISFTLFYLLWTVTFANLVLLIVSICYLRRIIWRLILLDDRVKLHDEEAKKEEFV